MSATTRATAAPSDSEVTASARSQVARPARYAADSSDRERERARERDDTRVEQDDEVERGPKPETKGKGKKAVVPTRKNRLRETRIQKMMSKAELARRANLSVLTIDRVEKGLGCRMDTKRKILEALGLSLADRVRVFGEEE